MTWCSIVKVNRAVSALLIALAGSGLAASRAAAQNACTKDEVFGGYSWLAPNGWGDLDYKINNIPNAFGASNTYYLPSAHNLGLVLDGSGHFKGSTTPPNLDNGSNDSTGVGYALGGLQYKWHNEKLSPFVRGFVGAANISPDCCHGMEWSFAAGGGGGLDLNVTRRFSIRLIQADYIYSSYSHVFPSTHSTEWNSVRLAAGVVINFGNYCNAQPVACTIAPGSPTEVWAGEPVKFSAAGSNFNPKHSVEYGWKSSGGKLSNANAAATAVDTSGLAPGSYAVTATVTDPKMKSGNVATCPAAFLVKTPKPIGPSVQCIPPDTTIKAGESAAVRMVATNPDNRPLTYAWTTTSGQVSGSGDSATVTPSNNDAGGTITVTGTVNDDRNLSASCRVFVTVPKLPPPCIDPEPWGSCTFAMNPSLPARVDNDCKDVLDKLALQLQGTTTGRLVVVGSESAAKAAKNSTLGAERAQNAEYYLTTGGPTRVDADRVETRQGGSDEDVVRFFFIPAGDLCAGHAELGTTFDEAAVKGRERGKLPQKKKGAPAQ